MVNRIQDRIEQIDKQIKEGGIPAEKIASLNKSLKTSWKDLVEYQNLQAAAHAAGKITTEEADLVYRLMGKENPTEEKWNRLSVAEKVAITQLMAELLDWRIKTGTSAVRRVAEEEEMDRWYHPTVHTGWKKSDPATTRRRRALAAHKGDRLAAGRSLQALANVTTDKRTSELAATDARYFFRMHKKYGR